MKFTSNLVFIGLFSLLIGSVFASPLLLSELDIVPFRVVPEGPKAEFSVNVAYANFTIYDYYDYPVTDNPFVNRSGGDNIFGLDYYIVLNITNHSDLPARVAYIDFVAAQNTTIFPSAFGGFYGEHEGTKISNDFGPSDGYVGHIQAGRVEGVWLDDEWINTTWVPEGGLDEIWFSENILYPEELAEVWPPPFYPYAKREPTVNYTDNMETMPSFHTSSAKTGEGFCYTYDGTFLSIGGGNYWIEGVPLKEYIINNELKTTVIYHDGSWIDATGRITVKERPYVCATNTLLKTRTCFGGIQSESNDGLPGGMVTVTTPTSGYLMTIPKGFSNIWSPQQSRLILVKGTVDIDIIFEAVEQLKRGEIVICSGLTNHLTNETIDGNYVYTYSSATELKAIQLDIIADTYLYNTILSDDEMFVTDALGLEVFIEPRG